MTRLRVADCFDASTRRRLVLMIITCLIWGIVAGCSQAPSPTVPPKTDIPVAGRSPADDAVAAYRGMWDAYTTAGHTSDWMAPELRKYTVGLALDQLVDALQANQADGVVTTGAISVSPTVISALPEAAPAVVRIRDCADDGATNRVRAADQQVLPGGQRGRRSVEAEVKKQDSGNWKVSDVRVRQVGTC